MKLSIREEKIINKLLERDGYISAKELSECLNTSEKTIYRDMRNIKKSIDEKNEIIINIPGKGYKINYKKYLERNIVFQSKTNENFLSVDDRRNDILINLLITSPKETSISKLSEKYMVGPTSIVKDFKIIGKILNKTNIRLEKNYNGTYIQGSEIEIRKFLIDIVNDMFEKESYEPRIQNEIEEFQGRILYSQFTREDIHFVKSLLDHSEEMLGFNIANPYYINIFTHILILIKRLRIGQVLMKEIDCNYNKFNDEVMTIAKQLVNKLQEYLYSDIPEYESYFIYKYLISCRGVNDIPIIETKIYKQKTNRLEEIVDTVIEMMSKRLNMDLCLDNNFRKSLLLHFEPMLKRVEYKINIKNVLLEKIIEDFNNVYVNLTKVLLEIEEKFELPNISRDEIGFISLYFQSAIESNIQQKNILIVCSTGIGTSHLLKSRVIKSFPEWNIIDVISANKVNEFIDNKEVDFILTTVKLEEVNIPTIIVSALFSEKDAKNVKEVLRNIN